jgi:hypothetical protein
MKIGILTFPLRENYGSILQAYALQTTLKRMKHEVWLIDRRWKNDDRSLWRKVGSIIKQFILYVISNSNNRTLLPYWLILEYKIMKFKKKYTSPTTLAIWSNKSLQKIVEKHKFDAYVVGSDQVWRLAYSPNIANYFLDFVKDKKNIKRIAYAVSFGVDHWEFTEHQTRIYADLIKKFDAISVREDSGIKLCKEYLGVDAIHLLDPAFLLDKSDYIMLVENAKEPPSVGNLHAYILDSTNTKSEIIRFIADKLHLSPFSMMFQPITKETQHHMAGSKYPSITKWLRSFMDADFVVTDSFHGCVFSIIFNKSFVVIGNEERGMARVHSLLSLTSLEERLINSYDDLLKMNWNINITWEKINKRLAEKRKESIAFLMNNLS